MSKYRLLALDLDGTLLNNEKKITETTKKWLERTEELGIKIVFATGRGFQRVEHLLVELNLEIPMVLLNGAEIWEQPNQLLERHFIRRQDIINLHSLAIKEKANYWGYDVNNHVRWHEWNEDMFNKDWMKFGISHPDLNVIKKLKQRLKKEEHLEITSSAANNIECSRIGLSKEYGIKKICDNLNIDIKEVMAIGDNMNDYRLIKTAGLGIAMGNSAEELKVVADDITASNEKNGVAKALEKHLF